MNIEDIADEITVEGKHGTWLNTMRLATYLASLEARIGALESRNKTMEKGFPTSSEIIPQRLEATTE